MSLVGGSSLHSTGRAWLLELAYVRERRCSGISKRAGRGALRGPSCTVR